MKWTDEQQQIIDSRHSNLLVAAAAGSGKTAVLVERIIQMVTDTNNPIDIDKLLVVTYTNAAAAQMREKIGKALEEKLREDSYNDHVAKQMALIHRANIITIDSFCLKIVRENFNSLGIDPTSRVADTAEMDLIKSDVLGELLEDKYQEGQENYLNFVECFSQDKTDENIETIVNKIYTIASSYSYPSLWLEKAKKAILFEDERQLNEALWMINLIDKTKITIGDIKETILKLIEICDKPYGPYMYKEALIKDIEWMDEIASCKLYQHFAEAFSIKPATLKSCRDKDVDANLMLNVKATRDKYKKVLKDLNVFGSPVEDIISDMKNVAETVEVVIDLVMEYSKRLDIVKRKKNIMEFADVEHMALTVLCQGYDEEGRVIPSNIAKKISKKYEEVFIDEYQDSNFLQEDILTCVSRSHMGEYNIFMVGDVKQSIYKFRMARPDLFIDKYNTYKEHGDFKKIELKNNFRSRNTVLESINYIFYQIMTESVGGIKYNKEAALVPGRAFVDTELPVSKETELIIIEKDEEGDSKSKIEAEAKVIAQRIKELVDIEPLFIVNEHTDGYRKAQFGDIVILLRSIKGWADVFSKILMDEGIPVHTNSDKGYFDTVEIKTILCMLSIIDNRYMDLEFAAVLRSYIGGISDEELAVITIKQRRLRKDRSLYNGVNTYIDSGDNIELVIKLKRIISLLEELKLDKKHMSISQIIWKILNVTGYFNYVGTMPSGKRRQSNILLLIEKANKYEETSYKGVFNFLRYIEKLKNHDLDFGEVNVSGERENAVRIISMHKSKGLEFPIVFVAGLGKQFNNMDMRESIVVHPDYFLGPKLVDISQRRWSNTLVRGVLGNAIKNENTAEELRILYVAMTRAEEKLILTGGVNDLVNVIESMKPLAQREEVPLPYTTIIKEKSCLGWIIAALMRNMEFAKTMEEIPAKLDKKQENYVDCKYELDHIIQLENANFKVKFVSAGDLEIGEVNKVLQLSTIEDKMLAFELQEVDLNLVEMFKNRFQWQYKDLLATKVKGKISVTELKKLKQKKVETSEKVNKEQDKVTMLDSQKPVEVEATTLGTGVHRIMELIQFEHIKSIENIRDFINTMIINELIDQKVADIISVEKIYQLINGELGQRMLSAFSKEELFREQQFVAGLPMKDVYPDNQSEEIIIIQGIIDAYFIEDNKIVIVDYKTDRVSSKDGTQVLIDRYESQLNYYGKILGQITGMDIKEKIIYSFALDKSIIV